MIWRIKPLVEKEIKDMLRDPRIYIGIISTIIILPLMGAIFQVSFQSSISAVESATIVLVDFDNTDLSKDFLKFLADKKLNIEKIEGKTLGECLEAAREMEAAALIAIPEGFASKIQSCEGVNVSIYYIVNSVSTSSTLTYTGIENVVSEYSQRLSDDILTGLAPNVDPEILKNPIKLKSITIFKGVEIEAHPGAIFSSMMMTVIISVLTPFMLTIFIAQIAATATAVENEEKTLETLLTLPVSRFEILLAKLFSSSVIAILYGGFYLVGFYFYMRSFTFGLYKNFSTPISISPTIESFIVTGILVILSMIFVTSLGVLVGALSSDVRIANSFIGYLTMPIMIPAMFLMFTDIQVLPLPIQAIIYALPTSYPLIAVKSMILGELSPVAVYGILYSLTVTLLVIYVAAKLLTPEKLLTLQYKLMIRRKKKIRFALFRK
ncbi:MAG: ABC transporter permease [Thermoproteales archaeon]|nr:ABC transporter permease [Thermoproteales archaeon]